MCVCVCVQFHFNFNLNFNEVEPYNTRFVLYNISLVRIQS